MVIPLKDKIIILCFTIFIHSCSSQNTTDAQVSQSIKESKNNGFFIKKYEAIGCTDKNIFVEEAWLENIWFNKFNDVGKIVKVKDSVGRQLCFKLKQTPRLNYSQFNFLHWLMEFKEYKKYSSTSYVGMVYGVYELSFNTNIVPDTIKLDLISRKDTNDTITDTKVGELIFRAANVPKPK